MGYDVPTGAATALEGDIERVEINRLPPSTTLLVRTMNSVYRVVITRGSEVSVQGGIYFSAPTTAYIEGAAAGADCLTVGWIVVGLFLAIRAGSQRVITSPVRAISIVRPCASSRD